MNYYKIMALDVGKARIGIALSDLMRMFATPFETIEREGLKKDIAKILEIANNNDVKLIVCGLPLKLDNTDSIQTESVRKFGNALSEAGKIEVVFFDEKLTTVEAHDILQNKKENYKERKKSIDKVAAAIILQSYLKEKEMNEEKNKSQDEIFDEMEGDIVEFETEDGKVIPFEHICTIEVDGTDYFMFSPLEASEDISEDEVAIFTLNKDKDGELIYELVQDEKILDKVYEEYVAIMTEEEENMEPCDEHKCSGCSGCGHKKN